MHTRCKTDTTLSMLLLHTLCGAAAPLRTNYTVNKACASAAAVLLTLNPFTCPAGVTQHAACMCSSLNSATCTGAAQAATQAATQAAWNKAYSAVQVPMKLEQPASAVTAATSTGAAPSSTRDPPRVQHKVPRSMHACPHIRVASIACLTISRGWVVVGCMELCPLSVTPKVPSHRAYTT